MFGRWGERVVAAAFRREGYKTFLGPAYNIDEYRDLYIRKKSFMVSVQVKATAMKGNIFRQDAGQLRRYLEIRQERDERFILCVANLRLRFVYSFPEVVLERELKIAEDRNALAHIIGGNAHLLCKETTQRPYPMEITPDECKDGARLVKGRNADESKQISLLPDEEF